MYGDVRSLTDGRFHRSGRDMTGRARLLQLPTPFHERVTEARRPLPEGYARFSPWLHGCRPPFLFRLAQQLCLPIAYQNFIICCEHRFLLFPLLPAPCFHRVRGSLTIQHTLPPPLTESA